LNQTVSSERVSLKPVPVIVTLAASGPEAGLIPLMAGPDDPDEVDVGGGGGIGISVLRQLAKRVVPANKQIMKRLICLILEGIGSH
jgi:hypothetical protein